MISAPLYRCPSDSLVTMAPGYGGALQIESHNYVSSGDAIASLSFAMTPSTDTWYHSLASKLTQDALFKSPIKHGQKQR